MIHVLLRKKQYFWNHFYLNQFWTFNDDKLLPCVFRYNHFLPNSQSEGIRVSPDGDMVSMFSLLSNVLRNSSTSQDSRFALKHITWSDFFTLFLCNLFLMFQVDSFYFLFWTSCRKLCLVWLFEILDKAVTTGVLPLVSKNISLDSIALSILPSSEWSIHFCQIYTRQFLGQKPNSLLSDSTNSLKHCECKNLESNKLVRVKLL